LNRKKLAMNALVPRFGGFPGPARRDQALLRTKEAKKDEPRAARQNFCLRPRREGHQGLEGLLREARFPAVVGQVEQNWVVMMNGTTSIALFHGFFENETR
jgi:hypothetical protein